MENNEIFNLTICIVGIAILLIHVIDLMTKKNKRKDEKNLLIFFIFTFIHFATYLTFTLIKPLVYPNNAFIVGFYTIFYIMNNVQMLLLFVYTVSYIYLEKKVVKVATIINHSIFLIFIVLDIVNAFVPMFFSAYKGEYVRTNFMIISQGYQFVGFALVFILAVFNKKVDIVGKLAFSFYCILPFVAVILQNFFKGYAIAYLSIVITIEILFSYINIKKNDALIKEEQRNKEAEIKLMMSQIQPHFIYNTLASISTLIKIDPDKAEKALDAFTEYLRANLSSLSSTRLISFNDELKHIETYLSLEKVRFEDRINVNYDIETKDFLVPPLSIQPLVENAVKHGILQNIEGGTITIKTFEDELAYYVEIIDDGVGFDVNDEELKNDKHVGLNNVRSRIASMTNGEIKIDSEVDKGTYIVVTFYK